MNSGIEQVYLPNEIEIAKSNMVEIYFECVVTMYESLNRKKHDPQWFRNRQILTLEFIKSASEYEIGAVIKKAFIELDAHIRKYEYVAH